MPVPVRTYGNGILIISGDQVRGEDALAASGSAGSDLQLRGGAGDGVGDGGAVTITAGAAGASANAAGAGVTIIGTNSAATGTGDGGSITLQPGLAQDTGTDGLVTIDSGVADTEPLLRLDAGGTNGAITEVHTGTRDPNAATISGVRGSLYLRNPGGGTAGSLWVNTSTTDPGTTWTDISSGAGVETLAETLVAGNVTGGTDIEVTAGDSIESVSGALDIDTVGNDVHFGGEIDIGGAETLNSASIMRAVGTSGKMTLGDSIADATQKTVRLGCFHYTNSEEPVGIINAYSNASDNVVNIGGGSSAFNAAKYVQIYTAADTVTQAGTVRAYWNPSGKMFQVSDLEVGGLVTIDAALADTSPLQRYEATGANGAITEIHTGTRDPNAAAISAVRGSLYLRNPGGGTAGSLWVNTSTTDPGTTWTDVSAGGSSILAGLPGNDYEDLQFYMDAMDRNSYVGSGTTVTDIMGNGTAGTLTTATYGDGGFEFNATSGDLSFTKGAAIDNIFNGGGTIITFFQPAGEGEGSAGRIATTEGSGGAVGWFLATEAGTGDRYMRVAFQRNSDATDGQWEMSDIDGVRPFRAGSWVCVGVSYDDSALGNDPTFYLNGEGVSSSESATPTGTFGSDVGEDLFIGNRDADDRTFDGTIGLVLLFDRVLTAQEQALVFNLFSSRYGAGFRGRPQSVTDYPGAAMVIAAGDMLSTASATDSDGGPLTVRAGHTLATGGGSGGHLSALGGDGRVGGGFTLKGGDGDFSSEDCEIAPGDVLDSTAGDLTIHGGDGSVSGTAGDLILRGGDTTAVRAAGDIYLIGGVSADTAVTDAGDVFIRAGENADPDTGNIDISTFPASGNATASGHITIRVGTSTADPGDLTLSSGDATGSNEGGQVFLSAGSNTGTGNGGAVNIDAGDSVQGDGGDVTITAGDTSSTGSTDHAGNVDLVAGISTGASGGNNGGSFNLTSGTSVSGAGGGFVWTGGATSSGSNSDPGGSFTLTGGNQTDTGSQSSSGGGGFSFTGGSCAGTNALSTGGNFIATGGAHTGSAANVVGGAIRLTGGAYNGNTAGADGGPVVIKGGASDPSAAVAGTGGPVSIFGGEPTGDNADTGGAVDIQAGGAQTFAATNVIGGDATFRAGDGVGVGRAGGTLNLLAGDGNSAGDVNITAGAGLANANGGDVVATAGAHAGAGVPGGIDLRSTRKTTGINAAVRVDTQNGSFNGSQWQHMTVCETVGPAGTPNALVIPGPSVNGQNIKIRVWATGQKQTTTAHCVSQIIEQSFRRSGGTTVALTAHQNSRVVTAGTPGAPNMNMTFVISGSNINVRLAGDTIESSNWALEVDWQRGGMGA